MDRKQIDSFWNDESNWTLGIIYRCSQDPRSIVPRRWRWGGWTLNFAHPRAGLVGLGTFALAVVPGIISLFLFGNPKITLLVMLASIMLLFYWAHKESSRSE